MKPASAISMKLSYVPDSSPGAVMDSGASGRSVVEPSECARSSASFQFANVVRLGAEQSVQIGEGQALDGVVDRS